MTWVPERSYVTTAFVAMLAAATGRPVGDGRTPEPAPGQNPELPYYVVHAIPGGYVGRAGYSRTDDQVGFVYQVDSVAAKEDRLMAEWAADTARIAILGVNDDGTWTNDLDVTVPEGRTPVRVANRRQDGPPSGVDTASTLATAADRYVIEVTADG